MTRPDFEELALPLFASLYNFARWLTRDPSEAEDLVQETYVRALKGFHGFAPGTSFRAWIFRIEKNAFLTARGAPRLRAVAPLDEEGDVLPAAARTTETPESLLIDRDGRARVREAIAALPPLHREIVLLRDVEGLSYAEIAEALEIPQGTVMSRLHRARQAIRDAVGGSR